MHKALNPRDDIDRLHVSRKEGGRGLTSFKDSVDSSIRRHKNYIKKEQRKGNDSDQKQHKDQQNNNN